jgi:hypothetical protein
MQFKTHPNTLKRQNREVGGLLVLLALYGHYTKFIGVVFSTIILGVLLLGIIFKPELFDPLRWIWFKLATVLGAISSRIVLTLAYLLVLLPVSLIKAKNFRNHFKFEDFKRKNTSVLIKSKTQEFSKEDIINPY